MTPYEQGVTASFMFFWILASIGCAAAAVVLPTKAIINDLRPRRKCAAIALACIGTAIALAAMVHCVGMACVYSDKIERQKALNMATAGDHTP